MSLSHSPKIPTANLVLYFDAANIKSYPGSGTSWTDLKSNVVATMSNVTYSSPAMIYNGSSSTASFSISGINFSLEQTIIMGIMPNEADGNRRNPYANAYGGYGTITHEVAGNFNYYHGTNGGNGSPFNTATSGFTVGQNEKSIICVARGPSTVNWYKNGNLQTVTTNSYPQAVSNTSTATIGSGYVSPFSGDIYFLAMYNRQLSPNEVKEFFNAVRGRYGL